ncbi:MAG: PLP-dependent cysteine synthase family protein [Candidatus Anammoxibacter sp.]
MIVKTEKNMTETRFGSLQSGNLVFNNSILEGVGNTPLIKLNNISNELSGDVEIYAKVEWFNPGGSVKDRAALNIIEDAERCGKLTKGKIIIDSTSGNTGIAYSLVGAVKGYKVSLVMPSNVSTERKSIVRFYGADIIYTDPLLGSDGAILEVRKLVKENPEKYFYGDQYNNDSNWQAHYKNTAVEIWDQTNGNITHFVAGLGTSGTFIGTTKRLKEFNDNIKTFSVEPTSDFHGLEGLKHMASSIVPGIYDQDIADERLAVETEDALDMVKTLAAKEGLFAGYSSGAALKAALDVARDMKQGLMVVVFPDGGDRYLSTSFMLEQ